jgi:hypothetical protein
MPNDAHGGLTHLEQSRAQIQQMNNTLADTKQRRDLLKQQLDATPQTVSTAELAAATRGTGVDPRVLEAEAQLRELRMTFTEQHPAVITARNRLAEIRAEAKARPAEPAESAAATAPRVPNPLYEQLKLRLVDADAGISALERRLREEQVTADRLQAMARGAPQLQAEALNIDRDYNVLRGNYENLLARRESIQIAGAARAGAERVRLDVIDPPTLPTEPVSPNRPLLYSAVLLVGLGAGAALAVLLTLLDRGFYTLGDLRRLGLPVRGGISSADPPARVVLPAAAFGVGLTLLLMAFGTVLVGGARLMARLPELLTRMMA